MPITNLHNRRLKSEMTFQGIQQKDILPLLKDKRGKPRCRSYLDARMNGREDFTKSEMLVFKSKLHITSKDDFLNTFFPGEKWEGA